MPAPKPDMDLSEFMGLCTAKLVPGTNDYIVEFKVFDGSKVNLTVAECTSEFDAKERTYLYLLARIYEGKEHEE